MADDVGDAILLERIKRARAQRQAPTAQNYQELLAPRPPGQPAANVVLAPTPEQPPMAPGEAEMRAITEGHANDKLSLIDRATPLHVLGTGPASGVAKGTQNFIAGGVDLVRRGMIDTLKDKYDELTGVYRTDAAKKRARAAENPPGQVPVAKQFGELAAAIEPTPEAIAAMSGPEHFAYKATEGLGQMTPALIAAMLAPVGTPGYFALQARGAAREQAAQSGASQHDQDAYVDYQTIIGALFGFQGPARALKGAAEPLLGTLAHGAGAMGTMDVASQAAQTATIDPGHKFDPLQSLEAAGLGLVQTGLVRLGVGSALSESAAKDPAYAKALADAGVEVPPPDIAPKFPQEPPDVAPKPPAEPAPGEPSRPAPVPETAPVAPTETPVSTPEAGPERVTGIANEPVEAQRAELGMAAAEHGPFKSDEAVHTKAVEKMQADAGYGERLVKDLTEKPRPPTTEETAALSLELVRLSNERDAAQTAYEAGQTPDTQARIDKAQADYDTATNTATLVGTESAQAFRLRQWLLKQDYSLAAITRRAGIEAGDIKPEEKAALDSRITELAKRVKDTEDAFNAYIAGEPARQSEAGAQKNLKPTVREYLKTQADSARVRMKARLRTPQANLDPQAIIDLAVIGADHLATGVSEFGAWSKRMLEEFPDIGEHLQGLYEKSQEMFSSAPKSKGYLQAYKSRLRSSTAKLEAQAETGDVAPRQKNKLVLDDEAIALKAEHEHAKQQVQRLYHELQQKNRTKAKIAADAAREILDLPKAIWSSYDLSAVLRQGAFFTVGHPIQSIGHVKQMLRAAGSERAAREIDVKLRNRPGAAFGEMSKLDLTHTGDVLGTHEEAIRSRLSDKIPGVTMSNRAFTTYLNTQRAAMFDELVRSLPGEVTLAEGKAIANLVNVGTGRGNPGRYAAAVNGLSTVMWAPRLLLSRFQLLAGQPAYGGTARTRGLVAKQYAHFLIGMGAIYTMGALLGGKEEKDPRSPDAGKIRFGDTRLDPMAGLAQVTRLLSVEASGKRKNAKGQLVPVRGNVPFGSPNAADVVFDFARTKLTPLLGIGLDVASGESVVGEKTTPAWIAEQAVPLSIRDIYSAMREQGVGKGAAMGILSIFGMGLQTYSQKR